MSKPQVHPELTHLLQDGLDELGLVLAQEQVQSLIDYIGLLLKWNRVYNLTAITDPKDIVVTHLLDALSVIDSLDKTCPSLKEVLDVGTGAGIPAVILSIVKPGLLVHCVDAVQKKIAFLQQVALSLHLTNLKPIHARVQDLSLCSPLICSRAFASLDDFVRLTKQQLHPQGVWMAMKARVSEDELKSVPKDIEVFHVEPIRVPFLDAQRCLVWMRPKS